ncbi:MAG TPA: PASTA domain-containing protein, partial [Acidimicrobiales bacterium]|nr:PASTA domain-containing protein [Acidimicrobiales bacterium]
ATTTKLFTPSHPVPLLVGKTPVQAVRAVKADKFHIRTTGHVSSITVGAGLIVSQQPTPRSGGRPNTAKQGSTIGVVVSTGPPPVAIPDLSSFTTCNDAVQALKEVNLVGVCPPAAQQYSPTVASGAVLGTSPTGTAPYGSTVTVITSKGHAPVAIPAVAGTGTTYASAAAALTAVGFVPGQNNEYNPTVPTGSVIGTNPPTGPLPYGSKVVVNISLGPQPVIVPDVVGQSVTAAEAALGALGLKVGGPYGPPGATTVLSTDPTAGTSVQAASTTVNIYTL